MTGQHIKCKPQKENIHISLLHSNPGHVFGFQHILSKKTKQKNEKLMPFFISISTKSVSCDQNVFMNMLDEKVEGRVKLLMQN